MCSRSSTDRSTPRCTAWISSFWGTSENNRRARYYRLTPKGRAQLAEQTSRWDEIVRAINRILRPAD
jgi:DNA-binding PadR family transcriptional regulator